MASSRQQSPSRSALSNVERLQGQIDDLRQRVGAKEAELDDAPNQIAHYKYVALPPALQERDEAQAAFDKKWPTAPRRGNRLRRSYDRDVATLNAAKIAYNKLMKKHNKYVQIRNIFPDQIEQLRRNLVDLQNQMPGAEKRDRDIEEGRQRRRESAELKERLQRMEINVDATRGKDFARQRAQAGAVSYDSNRYAEGSNRRRGRHQQGGQSSEQRASSAGSDSKRDRRPSGYSFFTGKGKRRA